ncbi:MAG: hypothetical protein MSD82_07720 [Prevotella sp.]|nr:hypothetical protein [Prevotella sp.]
MDDVNSKDEYIPSPPPKVLYPYWNRCRNADRTAGGKRRREWLGTAEGGQWKTEKMKD